MNQSVSGQSAPSPPPPGLQILKLESIVCDHKSNDRLALDRPKLEELANSIRAHGLLAPLVVAADGDTFTLIAGHRRHAALILIGAVSAPCVILDKSSKHTQGVRLAENLVRADLSPVEEARAIASLIEKRNQSPEDLSISINRSVGWIRHRLALANYPVELLEALHLKTISLAVADELALIRDADQRSALLSAAVQSGCTGRQAALWRAHANAMLADPTSRPTQPAGPDVIGPPPVVTKSCFVCDVAHPITSLSYLTVCPQCVALISAPTPPPPPPLSTKSNPGPADQKPQSPYA